MLILSGGIVCLPGDHQKCNNRGVTKQSVAELGRVGCIWLRWLPVWETCVNPISLTWGHRMGECPCSITCLSVLLSDLCNLGILYKKLW